MSLIFSISAVLISHSFRRLIKNSSINFKSSSDFFSFMILASSCVQSIFKLFAFLKNATIAGPKPFSKAPFENGETETGSTSK